MTFIATLVISATKFTLVGSSSLFALGKPQQPPPCLLSDGNISGRSSPPSTSARLPLRSGGITSRFAVGRASGRDDRSSPPLHRPIERLGKRPPRLAGEPCPAPLLSGLSGAEGGGCPPPQGLLGFGGGGDVPPPPSGAGLLSGGRGLGSGSRSGFGREGASCSRGAKGPPPAPTLLPSHLPVAVTLPCTPWGGGYVVESCGSKKPIFAWSESGLLSVFGCRL